MKRILNMLLAVVTCFCVLIATTVPAFATASDEEILFVDMVDSTGFVVESVPAEDFDLYDYAIDYDDFLNFQPGTLNAASGLLGFDGGMAWSSTFASLGLTCVEGGPYILGLLLIGGACVYAADGIYRTLAEDAPKVFYDFVSWIWLNSSDDTKAWLEEAFDLYCASQPISISGEMSASIVEAMEGFVTEDELGNMIDTSLSISASSIGAIFTDGIYSSTLTLYPDDVLITLPEDHMEKDVWHSASADCIRWDKYLRQTTDQASMQLYFSNTLTGSSINLSQIAYQRWAGYWTYLDVMSKFYQVLDASGLTYWVFYSSRYDISDSGGSSRAINALNCSAERPIYLNGTNTILDGKTIVGCTINSDGSGFTYSFDDGTTTVFPLDPIGLVISNTGDLVTGADVINPSDATAIDEGEDVIIPYCPPVAGVDTPSIGVPFDDSYITTLESSYSKSETEEGELVTDNVIMLDTPTAIEDFLGQIIEYFSGLFDWLPERFSNALDNIWVTLQTLVLIMVAVKIIDIVWP